MATQFEVILVTGARGQQGGAVATALLTKGQKIRVMSRTPEKPAALAQAGAEVVKGNLTNASDLQAALRGVHGVFAMSTPFEAGMDQEVHQGIMLADAAKQAGMAHYVYTSVGSAHRTPGFLTLKPNGTWSSISVRSVCQRPFCGPSGLWRISPPSQNPPWTGS